MARTVCLACAIAVAALGAAPGAGAARRPPCTDGGGSLNVTADASKTKAVGVHEPVLFSAHVLNATAADGPLSYTWDFQDPGDRNPRTRQPATGPIVPHHFDVAGPYQVIVEVSAADGAAGFSNCVLVTVGSTSPGVSPGKYGAIKPIKPIHFGSVGTTTIGSSAGAGSGSSGGSGTGGSGTGGSGTGGSGTGSRTGRASASSQASSRAPASTPPARHVTTQGGTRVDGLLVTGVVPVTAAQFARQGAGGSGPRPAPPAATLGAGSVTPLGGLAGGAAIVGLLAAGSGIEIRSRRRAATAA
ncbi:MAG TPA: PKD domain-containing protein [Solirubrobacteraceae bacterium]|nr:PKD domain-containing protein [Solirubrobacteraceae bacterium]